MERFEIFTICRRPPLLQNDASVGMMKIVVFTRAHIDNFNTRVSSFIGQHFGKKNWLAAHSRS